MTPEHLLLPIKTFNSSQDYDEWERLTRPQILNGKPEKASTRPMSVKSAASVHANSNASRERKTGWTAKAFAEQEVLQENKCAICSRVCKGKLRGDHKHIEPPQPRELLCGNCNSGLGMLGDDASILRAAANYIDKHNHISTRLRDGLDTCKVTSQERN